MVLTTYGRSSGFCVDPIEKKPLNHFLPGTSVLSFGTAGCNLGCRFCQNWDISKAREWDKLADAASPQQIALAAERLGCRSVAFTYNDPVIFAEYAIDVAQACRERGIKAVAVTAGYITDDARPQFYQHMDAAMFCSVRAGARHAEIFATRNERLVRGHHPLDSGRERQRRGTASGR
jgi:pyruvate formate lyase activating enzyme